MFQSATTLRHNPAESFGTRATDVVETDIEWYDPGFILRNSLNCIIGLPKAGKSTYGSWLTSKAKTACIISSKEESITSSVKPRLRANDCDLNNVFFLDKHEWTFPTRLSALKKCLQHFHADFLYIDCIDSHIEGSENMSEIVRPALESLSEVAHELSITIVFGRHPGKGRGNICPGARVWRAVPRSIVLLQDSANDTDLRVQSVFARSIGPNQSPINYRIIDRDGQPRYVQGDIVHGVPLAESDDIERSMLSEATHLIEAMLCEGECLFKSILDRGAETGLLGRTIRRAGAAMDVRVRREGFGASHRSYWSLPVDYGTPVKNTPDMGDTPPTTVVPSVPEPLPSPSEKPKKPRKSRAKPTPDTTPDKPTPDTTPDNGGHQS